MPSAPNAMTFDNDNRLWVHISNIGMRYYKNGEWFMPIANPSSRVNELKVDGDNRLWASTETNGLAYFNLNELEINSTELVKDEKVSVFPTLISDNITINIENLGLQGVEFKLLDIEGQIHLQEKIIQRSCSLPQLRTGVKLKIFI